MIANEPQNGNLDVELGYNRHYITVDEYSRVTDGWSDGPHPDRDTTSAICINEEGGYQFRLSPEGEENPALYDWDGMIPLYRWDGLQVVERTAAEIEADRAALPVPEVTPTVEERVTAVEQEVADLTAAVERGLTL